MSLVVVYNARRIQVKYSPSTALSIVRDNACKVLGIANPHSYLLKHGQKTLDLSLPVRLTGLVANAKLDLVVGRQNDVRSAQKANVKVKLQILDEVSFTDSIASCSSSWSIWQVLTGFESRAQQPSFITKRIVNGIYMLPSVQIFDTVLETVDDLKKSLNTLGCKDSVVLRVKFVSTGLTWEQFSEKAGLSSDVEVNDEPETPEESNGSSLGSPIVASAATSEDTPSQCTPDDETIAGASDLTGSGISQSDISNSPDRRAQIYLNPDTAINIPSTEDQEMNLSQFSRYQSHLKSTYDRNDHLMTRAMREKHEAARLAKIQLCIVRVRLPDQSYIEGSFSPTERVKNLYDFIRDNLKNELRENTRFQLFTTPPKVILGDMNKKLVSDLKFGPRNVMYLEWLGPSPGSVSQIFNQSVFAQAKPITESEDVKLDRQSAAYPPEAKGSPNPIGSRPSIKGALSKPKWMKLSK